VIAADEAPSQGLLNEYTGKIGKSGNHNSWNCILELIIFEQTLTKPNIIFFYFFTFLGELKMLYAIEEKR